VLYRALDLFSGAGGASVGLARAGFEVWGVDIKPQPRYPFRERFIQGDALKPPFDLREFDFIWASPVCKAYSVLTRIQKLKRDYPRQIEEVRALLSSGARMWCIENVPGAPIRADVVLEGGQFDLDIVRRRHFEISGFPAPFGLARQQMRKVTDGGLATVAGKGANNAWNIRRRIGGATKWRDLPEPLRKALGGRNCVAGWRAAMGIDWMTRDELAQAIPPPYAEFIGRAAIAALEARRSAA
jgi:DNA (cytosine-5)-methyltransferase 1